MKRIALPLLLASTMLVKVASAQSSSTPVIGYYKFDVPTGNSAWVSGFVTKKDFQGVPTSVVAGATSTINQTGANFGSFPIHYIEIISGPKAGLILDILSNTSGSITVDADTAALGLTGSETYAVRKHATLGTLFAGGAGLAAGSDNVTIFDTTGGSVVYSYNGAGWEDALTGDPGDDAIIYPGQGFVITNGSASSVQVTFGGNEVSYVKTGPTTVATYAAATNLVGLVNPLVSTAPSDPIFATAQNGLGSLGLVASLTPGSDQIGTLSLDGSLGLTGVYTNNGSNIEDALSGDDATAVPVRNGAAFTITPGGADVSVTLPQLHP